MALVTIQRSPSPSTDPDLDVVDSSEDTSDGRSQLRKSLSESYFTIKGAALILPHTECTKKTTKKSHGGEIQCHLQAMLHLLRPEDTIKIAVRLEGTSQYQCYMALVSTRGRQDTEEAVILGIDCTSSTASIGLVLPMWMGLKIKLGGDGGFSLCTDEQSHLFKPVSVQAMWSAIQSLYKVLRIAEDMKYIPEGLTHTWVGYYRSRIDNKDSVRMSQWNVEGVEVFAPSSLSIKASDSEDERIKLTISQTLKEVMMTFDLDEATSVMLRNAAEQKMGVSLTAYKSYFDEEVMRIVGQMDKPSKILDFLYLGSEWNASNLEELIENGIGYILNVTREIDNFFEGRFEYSNVRVYDVDESDLLKHWDNTFKFISKARSHDSKVLVHCKMGVSRSASTVMAFIMKDQRMSVDEAFQYVKERRSCVHPNSGFMEQLRTYEGILTASNKRDIFRSKSEQNLLDEDSQGDLEADYFLGDSLFHMMSHTDWQSTSESMVCQEEFMVSLHKDHLYSSDILPISTDLEAAESRSADSAKELLSDISCQMPDVIIALQTPSAPVPILRPSAEASSTYREVTLEQEMSSELECCAALSSSEGSSSLQFRQSLGALGPRIKPDSSWIKMDTVELEKDDIDRDNLSFVDSLPLDNSSSDSQSSASVLGTPKFTGTIISQWNMTRPKRNLDGESKAVPIRTKVPGFHPVSSSPDLYSSNLSPEKIVTESFSSGVNFYLGSSQTFLDASLVLPVTSPNADTHFSSTIITKFSSGQRKSSDFIPFQSDHLTESQIVDVKQTAVEDISQCALANMLQKELLDKSLKCKNTLLDKQETDAKVEVAEHSINNRYPQSKIEPGVRQYFFREKIPWKPGKVKKMQEDINKTGQISQDENEEDKSVKEDLQEVIGHHANLNDEWTMLEQTSAQHTAVSLCQSYSCVELSHSDEIESTPMTLYEREEIPLSAGTVLRTRLEIEERQRLFCGEGDQVLFGTTRPVLRTSSLKQDRSSPRSRYTDNRRMTCGPIMSPRKSLDDCHSIGFECLFNLRSPTPLSPGQIEHSSEEHDDNTQIMDESHSVLHKTELEELPIKAGLVRKHKMELESKYEMDRTSLRANLRSSSPITIKTHLTSSAAPQSLHSQGLQGSFITTDRTSEGTENQYDSLSVLSQSLAWQAAKLNVHSDILIQETASTQLISSSPPDPKDVEGSEPSPNKVKNFVRKIEKQTVVSTANQNVTHTESDTKKATSPVKDECSKISSSSVGNSLNLSSTYISLNTAVQTKTAKPSDIFSSPTAESTLTYTDINNSVKYVTSEAKQEITHLTGFEKKELESLVEPGSISSSRMNLDLKLDTHVLLTQQVSNQTLENVSLSTPGNRVKEQVAALAETTKVDPPSSPRTSSLIVEHESPEPFVVKHLVERFENKSPESDIVSSSSSHDLILKLKDLRDFSISSPTVSPKFLMEEQTVLLPSLEDTTKHTNAAVSQTYFMPIDNIPTHPCSSSVPSAGSMTASSACSSSPPTLTAVSLPPLSFQRQHVSLDSAQPSAYGCSNIPFNFDIAVELHEMSSDKGSFNIGETSTVDQLSTPARKLGPVPFNRSIIESSLKKGWRSVRPKSAEHTNQSASCCESEGPTSNLLHKSDIHRSKYSSFPTAHDDDDNGGPSLRQVSEEGRKIRRLHGKSHPLTKLSEHCLGKGPFYSSM